MRLAVATPGVRRVVGGLLGVSLGSKEAHHVQGLVLLRARVPTSLHNKELARRNGSGWGTILINVHLDDSESSSMRVCFVAVEMLLKGGQRPGSRS